MIRVDETLPRKVCVQASDGGPGISNLDVVLSGTFKSRTGMGKGLFGVKRLSNRFDIATSERGTRVDAWVWL